MHCTQSTVIKRSALFVMFQQITTDSIHDLDEINCRVHDNKTRILFDTNYFGSAKTPEFLICESCFWCASHIPNSEKRYITICPRCNGIRLESIPIVVNEISKFLYESK
ncbi:MAG TPA: hypothetical protein VH796_03330 [Nitrososphaeraceae archaeon]